MTKDFLPTRDEALLTFTNNFRELLSLNWNAYGILEPVATNYAAKQNLFATRLQEALNPETRGKKTIFLKDEARKELVKLTREIGRQINNTLSVTDEQRQDLGLTIRKVEPTPVPAPSTEPFIQLKSVKGRVVTIELRQAQNKRGRPKQTMGASIFTATGETAPFTHEGWQYNHQTSKTTVEIDFGPSETGGTVWISAFWFNAKSQTGPASLPIIVNLPASAALPQEVEEKQSKRKAA